jgi:hypothetical protein
VAGERGPASAGTGMEGNGGGTDGDGAVNLRSAVEAGEVGPSTAGREEVVASDGQGAAERQGEHCDAEHRNEGALVASDGQGAAERQGEHCDAEHRNEGREWRGGEGFVVRGERDLDAGSFIPDDSLLLTGKEEKANIQNETNGPSVIVDGGEEGRRAEGGERRTESGGLTADADSLGRIGEADGGGEGVTFSHGDGGEALGARDGRRTVREEEGFLVRHEGDLGVGEDVAGCSLNITEKEDAEKIQNEINAPGVMVDGGERGSPNEVGAEGRCGRTAGGNALGAPASGRTGVVATDGPLAAERQGEHCGQGALQVVPSGAGREQVVASENQPEWRRVQMERMRREWMRRRAANQGGVREHAPTVEKGVTNGGTAPAEAGTPMESQDARGP